MKNYLSRATAILAIVFAVGVTLSPQSADAMSYDDCVSRLSDFFYKKGDTWPDAEAKAKKRCSFYTDPGNGSKSTANSLKLGG
jgi:hypothetical protein